MGTIFTFLMIIIMIACVLLVIIIMAQNPKGGGLSGTFGGASSAQFGVQRTNDFMEKASWTLGAVIVGLCLLSVIITAEPKAPAPKAQPAKEKTTGSTTKDVSNNSSTKTVPAQKPTTGQ